MEDIQIKKGLVGVIVDSTAISKAIPEEQKLTYRGYAVHELAEQCSFEEIAYLLWNGELPNKKELDEFKALEKSQREVSNELLEVIARFPKKAHPMDTLRTAVSFLGTEGRNENDDQRKALSLLAKIPTIIAADFRTRAGKNAIKPNPELDFSENFFQMCFEETQDPEIIKAFDGSLTLYAEHGFNASTFTARTIVSSLSDLHSGVTGAIGSLKGPLHGGANEAVMHLLEEIGSADKAKDWLQAALKEKRIIMGFGHRLYRSGDSRVPTMKKFRNKVAELKQETKWVEISNVLEETMIAEKGIHPNLDFPAGPTYYQMGFDINLFTPIFVMARITGWTAHIMEQLENNKLIRPKSHYVGVKPRMLG